MTFAEPESGLGDQRVTIRPVKLRRVSSRNALALPLDEQTVPMCGRHFVGLQHFPQLVRYILRNVPLTVPQATLISLIEWAFALGWNEDDT